VRSTVTVRGGRSPVSCGTVDMRSPSTKSVARAGARITWTSALSSLALFLTASVWRFTFVGVGHWPRPMWEDYRTTAFDAHGLALMGLGSSPVYAAVPCDALPLHPRLRLSVRTHLIQAAVYGWAGFWLPASLRSIRIIRQLAQGLNSSNHRTAAYAGRVVRVRVGRPGPSIAEFYRWAA